MDDAVRELLGRRKNRCIAIVLTEKEIHCDPHVPDESARKFRKIVLDQLNEFHDFCVDLLESVDGGTTVNQLWLDRLEEIYDYIVEDDEDDADY